ncbi:MAG: FxsA family protein [Microthrixaceae bacterium]|nr:FxsA family protein [Microthrixaceae bacterium]
MILWLGLGAVAAALLEIVVIVRVAARVGNATTLLSLVLFSAVGAGLVKHQGLSAMRRLRESVREGRIPTVAIVDGAMLVVAGGLLLPPGFLSGMAGLLLLIPPVRRLVGGAVADSIRARVVRRIPMAQRSGAGRFTGTWKTSPTGAGGARASSPPATDIIDIDGEEIDLFGGTVELGPVRGD